jgi:hypothetical protein
VSKESRLYAETLECAGFTLRVGRDGAVPVALEIEVQHPKFPEMRRTFHLSEYLREGVVASPTTIRQILSPDSVESTRLDALRVLTHHIASPELRRQGVTFKDTERVSVSTRAEQEIEAFRVESHLGTTWKDLLQGHTRQIVSVVREGRPIVDFSVSSNGQGEIASALINLLPLELRWPILDQHGSSVNRLSVWKVIDEYVTFLDKTKHYPWPQALEDLGALQDLRVTRGEADVDKERVSCVMQVALSVLDEHRYATDPSFSIVNPARAPCGLEGFARALPDERVLRTSGPDVLEEGRGFGFALGGFSTYGTPYKVSASVPHAGARVLWDAVRQIRFSRSWEELERGIVRLAESPGVSFSLTEVTDRALYPRGINELVERLRQRGCDGLVDVGVGGALRGADVATTAWIVGGLIRGIAPIHARVEGLSFSSSWRCQGFLDEDLHGQLVFSNGLGSELIVTPHALGGSWRARLESIERLLVAMRESPATFARDILGFEDVHVRADNLPSTIGEGAYANLDRIALLWQRSFKQQHGSEVGSPESSSVRARELADGRWMLARRFSVNGKINYHTLVIGPLGVEAIYLSAGQRTWLGQLRGTEVKPSSGRRVFEEWELQVMFPLFVPAGSSLESKNRKQIITHSVGDVSIRGAVSMKDFEPERNQRDLVSIASRWLRGLFR